MQNETASTRTIFSVDWTSGALKFYGGNITDFVSTWGNGVYFDSEEEARPEFERLVDGLKADWKCEHDCSNGRFCGAYAAKLEREVWELDEDGELYDLVDSEVLGIKIWDGESWVEDDVRW